VQEEKLPGQLSPYMLERYEHNGFEIQLRCRRNKNYLRRWFLSKVLTFGNLGEQEMILAVTAFNGYYAMERFFFFLIRRIKNRKTELLVETYELCQALYPLLFPSLPNVQDPQTEPRFWIVVKPKTRQKIKKSHRVRNPSAVGGKRRQGLSSLPTFSSGDQGPSNVDEIFLETLNMLIKPAGSV
jgi:hypothetical protein